MANLSVQEPSSYVHRGGGGGRIGNGNKYMYYPCSAYLCAQSQLVMLN